MSPSSVKSFVTYYLQNLRERTRREKSGTKWGIDWVAYNLGLAQFGKPVRLPFLRRGSEGYPKSKVEAEFGIDIAFVSDDGSALVVFVLKDEALTNTSWTASDFDRDLRLATTPDLSVEGLECVSAVTVILAYNKDDQQNGIEAYERFVAAAPTKVGDAVELRFSRWNLSDLVDQTIRHILSPSLLPERFFGHLSYLSAQAADFTHGSDRWHQQLVPNWKRFMQDVLQESSGTRGPELIPVAMIILREHAHSNPSFETGWIDLLEWAALALWNAATENRAPGFSDAVRRFWNDLYIPELERFYRAHIDALGIEQSIDRLAGGTLVGAVAASQIAYWHLARLGLLSLALTEQDRGAAATNDEQDRKIQDVANWMVMLINANQSALRPVLDLEHIQIFLLFETFHNAGRLDDAVTVIRHLEARLYLRRVSDSGLPFIDGRNSLDNVFEQVSTRPKEKLVADESSYFVLALLELCCQFSEPARGELLGRIHRHLVLGTVDTGDPGDRRPLDLVSWIPPEDWAQRVLLGPGSDGVSVAVHRFADTREAKGSDILQGIEQVVREMRRVHSLQLSRDVPLAALVLAALKHARPLPPELWRRRPFRTPADGESPVGPS